MTDFKEKYTDDKTKEPNKKLISADAFALGELLDSLINKIEHARLTMRK